MKRNGSSVWRRSGNCCPWARKMPRSTTSERNTIRNRATATKTRNETANEWRGTKRATAMTMTRDDAVDDAVDRRPRGQRRGPRETRAARETRQDKTQTATISYAEGPVGQAGAEISAPTRRSDESGDMRSGPNTSARPGHGHVQRMTRANRRNETTRTRDNGDRTRHRDGGAALQPQTARDGGRVG